MSTDTFIPLVVREFATDAEYRADPGFNYSKIKAGIDGSMSDLRHLLDNPTQFKVTPAMQLGTLVHEMVLEPADVWMSKYAWTEETDRRRKAYKDDRAQADAEGLILLPVTMAVRAKSIAEACFKNPHMRAALAGPHTTEVGMAITPMPSLLPGYRIKGKYDLLVDDTDMVDLKTTTESLDIDNLSRLIVKRNLHVQQALYWRILRLVRPELAEHKTSMAWLFARTEGALDTVYVGADDDMVAHAEYLVDRLLTRLQYSIRHDDWQPAHTTGFAIASLPQWVRVVDSAPAPVSPLPSNI
ncbi:MAG: hypothetical protein GY872_20955 [Roseibacillus sp.]|nr:hypothetical protein [Roseibacillus sp.]